MLYLSLFEAHSSPPKPYGYRWGVLLHNYENTRIDFQKNCTVWLAHLSDRLLWPVDCFRRCSRKMA